jgi:steroid 5-alpha reductase family enzyme
MTVAAEILMTNFAALMTLMTFGWLASLAWRNVTVVDSLWGSGFVLIAWLSLLAVAPADNGFEGRRLLLAVLTTVWGIRLTGYLTWRNWGKGEDPRYGKWRSQSKGRFWWVSLFKVFWLQAVFLWLIALALQMGLIAQGPSRWTWLDGLGLLVWVTGFLFETVGDWQLARFKAVPENKGKVMDKGLWAWTRHPNYFGEFLVWWGIFVIVLSTSAGWWTVISPVLITVVLTRMTGVQLTEQTILEKRPAYREYIRTTSAFFPRPPKKPYGDQKS